VRLFAAAWPSDDVRDLLERLPRPDDRAVRWTTRQQWHVTLAFVGEVADGLVPALQAAVAAAAAGCAPRPVAMGPTARRLGGGQLVVPVAGVDDLAASLGAACAAALGRPPEARPFRGHLTLARARRGGDVPRSLQGIPLEAAWDVDEIALVRSHLGGGPARYETLSTAALGGG
jgi:RNA 2',3'-cyclic 3'-phosphodiesterase